MIWAKKLKQTTTTEKETNRNQENFNLKTEAI